MTTTDNTADAAEIASGALMPDTAPDSLDAVEAAANGETGSENHAADAAVADDQGGADTFPRHVVEKLRRENASLRDRARTAESRLAAVQRQQIDAAAASAGIKPAALRAVAKDEELLAEDGSVDTDKLKAAVDRARETLGVGQPRRVVVGGQLLSGAMRPVGKRDGWASAFRPREK
ncbi:hypothetical protein [Mycolicibacterium elephantis]|uniref:Uncharacterized protein n=1 Tax=Mycolicibacterium elephantis TaxID=81858 RepID=A0A1X0D2N5_9MYCO|nr:hypothetical protein [Mycolicibacterium elephantis]ORA66030.1 hypothetical protein BST23_11935 [Mycolicibacterium elephantis]